MKLANNPTVTQALDYLRLSTNVQDWNRRRAEIQTAVSREEFNTRYAYRIDACGLIVQVLGKSPRGKYNTGHKTRKNG
jgi:hypothetical protein